MKLTHLWTIIVSKWKCGTPLVSLPYCIKLVGESIHWVGETGQVQSLGGGDKVGRVHSLGEGDKTGQVHSLGGGDHRKSLSETT